MNKTYWLDFDDAKLSEDFEEIRSSLCDFDLVGIHSPNDLIKLREFIYGQLGVGYFKSERHKIAFMLSKYESGAFNKELGITRRHYVDKELAKSWMQKMQNKFHPEKNIDIKSDLDFTKISEGINRAYGEMVGRR